MSVAPNPQFDPRSGATSASAAKRVLIVGINFTPEHAGIAPYTTALARQMVGEGHEVFVLCGLPSYPAWRVPREYRYRRRMLETIDGVRVARLWHYVPQRQTALRRGLYEVSFGAHVAMSRLPWKPDLVLAVVPSLLGAAAAARIARRTGAEFAVWIQDLMGPAAAQSGIEGGARAASIARLVERRVIKAADRIAVIHEAFVDYVQGQGASAGKVSVIKNWSHVAPPGRSRVDVRTRMGWPEATLVALHTGNMGAKQALENVVDAARLADRAGAGVRFVLMGDGSQRAALQARGAGVKSLEFCEPIEDAWYSDVLASADVLLVNERGTAVEMSLPSKLTSYAVAGQPVVAAVPLGGPTAKEVRARNLGIVIEPDRPAVLLDAVTRASRHATIAETTDTGNSGQAVAWALDYAPETISS